MADPLKVGDIVYSRDTTQHGYGEEATVTQVNVTNGPDFVPSVLYTVTTKSGAVLHDMMRGELSRTKPTPQVFTIQLDPSQFTVPFTHTGLPVTFTSWRPQPSSGESQSDPGLI